MAYPTYQYPGYQPTPYYPGPATDQLAQLRQSQQMQAMLPGQMPQQPPAVQANAGTIQPSSPQNNGIVWVSGKQEADNYFVLPNSAVALWDSNNPVIYLRKADSTGKPSTVVYDLVERTDNPPAQAAPQVDWDKVVTWDKLDEYLSERLKKPSRPTKPKEDE